MHAQLQSIYEALGITSEHVTKNKLLACEQPLLAELEVVDIDFEGKPFILLSAAARAWREMVRAADEDEIMLKPFSGFRSYLHQKSLIERHLKNGRPLDNILTHIAIPGFSEHHSGRAVDIHEAGHPVLEEEFERTSAFAWLSENATRFGFRLSYPRGNDQGIIYEPWHWYFYGWSDLTGHALAQALQNNSRKTAFW